MKEAPWFSSSVIYGIDVRRFSDGNGDGIGDFIGLKERVPYLHYLGIDCVWLSPFFRSPFADNGYDVSDYYSIDPVLGTLDDFLGFLHAAGEQGIRVVIDLVANHTSSERPWFQAARREVPLPRLLRLVGKPAAGRSGQRDCVSRRGKQRLDL